MGNFNRDKRSSGFGGGHSKGKFKTGGNRFGAQRQFGKGPARSQMHQAVCAECGKRCEVPFKPTGDKPVYCSDCFGHSPNYGSQRAKGNRDFNHRDSGDRQMFSATCANCGDTCEVPFKPTSGKPVLCSKCFSGDFKAPSIQPAGQASDLDLEELKEMVNGLTVKLDKVLTLLQRTTPVKEITVMKSDASLEGESELPKKKVPKAKAEPKDVKKTTATKKVAAKKAPKKTVTKKKVSAKTVAKKAVAKKKTSK